MTQAYNIGFESLPTETQLDHLPVQGVLPDWLTGTLIRNGPAQFEVNGHSYRHWFDGLAMLHAFRFGAGRVSYANRFLRSNAYVKDNANGKINYRSFAIDPCRSIFGKVFSLFDPNGLANNTNVNVVKLADQYLAMTETPMALSFDPDTLETLGVFDYQDGISGQITTAHPHYDFERGWGINYLLKVGANYTYQLYAVKGRKRHLIASIPVKQPSYMHSFGMTDRYLILAEYPLVLPPPLDLALGQALVDMMRWQPEQGMRFTIIDKDSGAVVARVEADAFFCFHHINAYEEGDSVVVDLAAYPDSSILFDLMLENLRHSSTFKAGEFRRYRVPLKGGRATFETIGDVGVELPRLNYRHNGKAYRYAYCAGQSSGATGFIDQLVKVDTHTGAMQVWQAEGCYPSEPVFEAAPSASAEDDGVVLTVVVDSRNGNSFLLVQRADTFEEIARCTVPHVIPFGFHGQMFQ